MPDAWVPIHDWPGPDTPLGKLFFANAALALAVWRSLDKSDNFAFGMIANAEAESALDPTAKGDYGLDRKPTAFGLHQLHMDRIAIVKARWGIDIATLPPLGLQIVAAYHELETFLYLGKAQIEAAANPSDAGAAACTYFERPLVQIESMRRGQMAQRWADHFKGL
jgi:hypothetical protein